MILECNNKKIYINESDISTIQPYSKDHDEMKEWNSPYMIVISTIHSGELNILFDEESERDEAINSLCWELEMNASEAHAILAKGRLI